MRVFVVVGTRPEAIKMAPVFKALVADPEIDPVFVSTGQHREMLDQVLGWFEIEPDHDFKIMRPGQSLSWVTSQSIEKLDALILERKPDAILAQGDTTTVLAAAIAAFNREVPFGHVEAGLRTHNLQHPFPEEGFRQMASRVTNWHFAPTQRAIDVLKSENLQGSMHMTGNTVIDALLYTADRIGAPKTPLERDRLVLITGHRRENHGDKFRTAFQAIADLAARYQDTDFVYPVHLNPNVQKMTSELLAASPNVKLIAPVAYPEMVALMKASQLILTDSGGVQEEAPSLGVPVLVMRNTTERQEAVEAGAAKLVGTERDDIFNGAAELLDNPGARAAMQVSANPFGDGHASQRIADILLGRFPTPSHGTSHQPAHEIAI